MLNPGIMYGSGKKKVVWANGVKQWSTFPSLERRHARGRKRKKISDALTRSKKLFQPKILQMFMEPLFCTRLGARCQQYKDRGTECGAKCMGFGMGLNPCTATHFLDEAEHLI